MRKCKRIISLVLIGLFLLPLFAISVRAESATVVGTTTHAFFQNSDGVPFSIPFYRLATGETAYGINVGSFGTGGDDYVIFDPEDIHSENVINGLRIILMNAPPLEFRQSEYYDHLTSEEKEYAVAVAIWAWILSGGTDVCFTILDTLSPMDGVSRDVFNLARAYIECAYDSYDEDFHLYAEPDVVRLDTNPDDPNTLKASFTVKLSGAAEYFIDYDLIPNEIIIEGYTGADGDVLTMITPVSYRGVTMEWEKVLYADSSTFPASILWLTSPVSGSGGQSVAALEIGESECKMYGNIAFKGMRGSLTIEKIDENDELIPASTIFRIGTAGGAFLYFEGVAGSYEQTSLGYASYLSTSNGKLTISNLPEGDYLLYEHLAPSGYTLRDAPEPFTVTYGTSQTIRFINKKLNGSLTLRKVDEETGEPLAGAVFNVYVSNGTIFDVLYTDQDGIATSKGIVAKGKYTVREFFAPQGYLLSDEEIVFYVTDDATVFDFTITNKKAPHGRISILKLDKDDHSIPLGGAVFGVFRESDNRKMAEMITNAQGIATSHDLVFGSYIVRELSPPYSYSPNDTEYPVELTLEEPTITLTIENELLPVHSGKITIMKTDSDSGEPLPEVEFGVYRAADFRLIGMVITDETGAAELDGIPIGQPMILSETRPAEGYPIPLETTTFILDSKDQIIHFDIENTKLPPGTGSIALLKTETGNPSSRLEGAVFDIVSDESGLVVASLTSGWSGRAVYDGLPYGNYMLVETNAPDGYVPLDDPIPFTLSKAESVVMLEIENEREESVIEAGDVSILKVDADDDDHVLGGAVFGIYNAETETMVGSLITGADGTATFSGLPYGDYYLQEIAAPSGYEFYDEKVPFTLDASHVSVNLVIENSLATSSVDTGVIEVLKVDGSDGTIPLDGAVFGIYKAATETMVGSLITDSDGTATFSGLPYGDYYLQEIAAPAGYERADAKYPFTFHADQTHILLEIENRKAEKEEGKIRIQKRDADNGKALNGAVFGVFLESSDEKLEEITTDANGAAISAALPLGRYYLKEIVAPNGYELSGEKHFVDLTESGVTVLLSITNKAVAAVGRVKLIKSSDDGKLLSGAVFGVYSMNGSTSPVQILVSGPDGTTISTDLPIGSYYLLEHTAPKGYKRSGGKHYFTIAANSLIEISIVNEKEDAKPKGTIEIYYKHIRYGTELHKSYSYTDDVGTDYMQWINKNGLDKLSIPPYFFIKAEYSSSATLIDGKLVIVYWYDDTASGGNLEASPGNGSGGNGNASDNEPIRAIPKTGEAFPWRIYVASGALFLCAGGTLFYVLRRRKRESGLT